MFPETVDSSEKRTTSIYMEQLTYKLKDVRSDSANMLFTTADVDRIMSHVLSSMQSSPAQPAQPSGGLSATELALRTRHAEELQALRIEVHALKEGVQGELQALRSDMARLVSVLQMRSQPSQRLTSQTSLSLPSSPSS